MSDNGAWIELLWEKPQTISHIQITFDSGFQRQLTLTAHPGHQSHMLRGPQPEVVKDYSLIARLQDGRTVRLAEVKDNYQRLCRHDVQPVEAVALRLHIQATNGAEEARVYEVRCYC